MHTIENKYGNFLAYDDHMLESFQIYFRCSELKILTNRTLLSGTGCLVRKQNIMYTFKFPGLTGTPYLILEHSNFISLCIS